jgi:hypothetical protein
MHNLFTDFCPRKNYGPSNPTNEIMAIFVSQTQIIHRNFNSKMALVNKFLPATSEKNESNG